jgi:hypothetical protein
MRRTAIDAVGGFHDLAYVIDLEYWTRLLRTGGVVALDETLGAFRVVGTSWSRRIGRDQSRQSAALFDELHRTLPSVVTRPDVRRGVLAARLQTWARLVLYAALRL